MRSPSVIIGSSLVAATAALLLAIPAAAQATTSISGISVNPAHPSVGQKFVVTVSGVADHSAPAYPGQVCPNCASTTGVTVYATIQAAAGANCGTATNSIPGQYISQAETVGFGSPGHLLDPSGRFAEPSLPVSEPQAGSYLICVALEGNGDVPGVVFVARSQMTLQIGAGSSAPCMAQHHAVTSATAKLARDRTATRKHASHAHRVAVARDKVRLSKAQAKLRQCTG